MTITGTKHFSLREIMEASAPATLAQLSRVEPNIRRTLDGMERVRVLLGNRPITLESFFRTQADNDRLPNASRTSDHMQGLAVDFSVQGMTPEAVMQTLYPHLKGLGIDQIIRYRTHVHIGYGYRQRGQASISLGDGSPLLPWTAGAQTFPISETPTGAPSAAKTPKPDGGAILALLFFVSLGALAYFNR